MPAHPDRDSTLRRPARTGVQDAASSWTFFRQWLRNPLAVAAISPSGRQLARRMIAELPPGARRVIELGGGTGVFTRALLEHGIAPRELMVVELNEELHHLLRRRFPESVVVCGDATRLPDLVAQHRFGAPGDVDAVISGLGLLSMARATQRAILEGAFDLMGPDGRFIQFTYGPRPPLRPEVSQALGLHAMRGATVFRNIPPATVFVYARARSRAIVPRVRR